MRNRRETPKSVTDPDFKGITYIIEGIIGITVNPWDIFIDIILFNKVRNNQMIN